MIERLEIIKAKYDELQAELMKPETLSNVNKTTELSREIASTSGITKTVAVEV